jgi:hypothetical protein
VLTRIKLKRSWPFVKVVYPFRLKNDLLRLLPSDLMTEVELQASAEDAGAGTDRLAQIWRKVGHSHRWHHYFAIYERAFSEHVGKPVRLLEIGVQEGGSLRMWKAFFGPDAVVAGIDIDPSCARYDDPAASIHVRIGSQADPAFLAAVVNELGPFDLVVDDGSHVVSHIITSFAHLYGAGLKTGGAYVVEDTHATYWRRHRDLPHAFSDFCRDLIDLMHAAYWRSFSSQQFKSGSPHRLSRVTVPALATQIDSIQVFDSVVIIRKPEVARTHLPVNSVVQIRDGRHPPEQPRRPRAA